RGLAAGAPVLDRVVDQGAVHHVLPDGGRHTGAVHGPAPLVDQRTVVHGAEPHGGGQLRGGTDHPGVLVLAGIAELGGTSLRCRRAAVGQVVAVGVARDRAHRLDDGVGDLLVDHLVTLRLGVVEQDLTVGVLHLLHEVRAVEDTLVGEGRQAGGHVHRTGLVLAQDDA